MKKLISLSLVLMLLLGILAVPALAEEKQTAKGGVLSYLAMTEEEDQSIKDYIKRPFRQLLLLRGVLEKDESKPVYGLTKQYDSLNALLMALQSGEVDDIALPYYTAKYLSSTNDNMKIKTKYYPEKATGIAEWAFARLSDGYSFMLKEDNTELRDAFNAQIKAMKEDGTLQKLVDEHIFKVSEGGEPVAVAFEKFEGEPIKVGVWGNLPPMDYVSPDGSFAGFNTAVLAEIGKRLQKNIELVQVENVGRALALSEGIVDVVFWTRANSEALNEQRAAGKKLNDFIAKDQPLTDEEKAIIEKMEATDQDIIFKLETRDMPEGTIVTEPYFSDIVVRVGLK